MHPKNPALKLLLPLKNGIAGRVGVVGAAGHPKELIDAAGWNHPNIVKRYRPAALEFPVVTKDGVEAQIPNDSVGVADGLLATGCPPSRGPSRPPRPS